jgi:hypothetical protein
MYSRIGFRVVLLTVAFWVVFIPWLVLELLSDEA